MTGYGEPNFSITKIFVLNSLSRHIVIIRSIINNVVVYISSKPLSYAITISNSFRSRYVEHIVIIKVTCLSFTLTYDVDKTTTMINDLYNLKSALK